MLSKGDVWLRGLGCCGREWKVIGSNPGVGKKISLSGPVSSGDTLDTNIFSA